MRHVVSDEREDGPGVYAPPARPDGAPFAPKQRDCEPREGRPVSLARPYARTGGRTHPEQDLALEALVTTSERGRRHEGVGTVEHRTICDFCVEARTVSDIVAELGLPLGVVKVLVADMARAGLVAVHQPGLAFGDAESQAFLQRLLQGLREL
jgi:hypothetical protein